MLEIKDPKTTSYNDFFQKFQKTHQTKRKDKKYSIYKKIFSHARVYKNILVSYEFKV
jgi:hypothetical protein